MLEAALAAARATAGAVDPTLGDALAALGYDRDFAEVAEASRRRDGIRLVRRPAPGLAADRARRRPPGGQRPRRHPAGPRLRRPRPGRPTAARGRWPSSWGSGCWSRSAGTSPRPVPGRTEGGGCWSGTSPTTPRPWSPCRPAGRSPPPARDRGSGSGRGASCTTSWTRPRASRSSPYGARSPSRPEPASRPTRGRPRLWCGDAEPPGCWPGGTWRPAWWARTACRCTSGLAGGRGGAQRRTGRGGGVGVTQRARSGGAAGDGMSEALRPLTGRRRAVLCLRRSGRCRRVGLGARLRAFLARLRRRGGPAGEGGHRVGRG